MESTGNSHGRHAAKPFATRRTYGAIAIAVSQSRFPVYRATGWISLANDSEPINDVPRTTEHDCAVC